MPRGKIVALGALVLGLTQIVATIGVVSLAVLPASAPDAAEWARPIGFCGRSALQMTLLGRMAPGCAAVSRSNPSGC